MGLDLYAEVRGDGLHARIPYGSFGEFRRRVARDGLGVELDTMEGFTPLGKPWEPFRPDPVVNLLCHSDCDGDLDEDECYGLAVRLRTIVKRWDKDDWCRVFGLELADLIEAVEKRGGRVVFR